jgi:hypothetical protein
LPILTFGDQHFVLSRFDSGYTDRLVFTLNGNAFAKLRDGAPAELRIGAIRLVLGKLNKSMLR